MITLPEKITSVLDIVVAVEQAIGLDKAVRAALCNEIFYERQRSNTASERWTIAKNGCVH